MIEERKTDKVCKAGINDEIKSQSWRPLVMCEGTKHVINMDYGRSDGNYDNRRGYHNNGDDDHDKNMTESTM